MWRYGLLGLFGVGLIGALACQDAGSISLDGDDDGGGGGGGGDDDTGDDDTTGTGGTVWLSGDVGFGEVTLGCDAIELVDVHNDTAETVEIADVYVTDDEVYGTELLTELPWTLEPGEYRQLAVTFAPQLEEERTASLEAITDHPDYGEVTSAVSGSGVAEDWQSDSHTVEMSNRVDILWVVDNSCSMIEEQAALAAMAGEFVDMLISEGVDYQIGVVTTDNSDLQGAVPYVTPETPEPAGMFADAVSLGTSGSGSEQPLAYGLRALDEQHVGPGGVNEGFLREEAGLVVIALTDEDDQSPEPAQVYADGFLALKDDPVAVAFNGVDGGETGCSGAGGSADPALRLGEVIAATGGERASICDSDWMPVLSGIPDLVLQPSRELELSELPVEATIEVLVEGEPLDCDWIYDAERNAVELDTSCAIEAEMEIEVLYAVMPESC